MAMIDPLENNLFDLPDYENTEDETFPPLPPPASPGNDVEWAQANGGENPVNPGDFSVENEVL